MLINLKAEMKQAGVTISDIANAIKKLTAPFENGLGERTLFRTRSYSCTKRFFPEMEIEYLFSEKEPSPERDGDGKAQPGSKVYFESIEIPGIRVKEVCAKCGTVSITLACETWMDAQTAQRQYESVCLPEIPIGQKLRIYVEQSGAESQFCNRASR